MGLTQIGYIAHRDSPEKPDGWLEMNSLGLTADEARQKAEELDRQIPHWAKLHPVRRIVRVRIEMIEL